jgi:acetyl-CoA carboxylase biotin carboxyl carrier protein
MTELSEYFAQALPRLLRALRESDVRELDVRQDGIRVRIHRADLCETFDRNLDGDAPVSEDAFILSTVQEVTSPVVGTFYRAAHPGEPPLVSEGAKVDVDTVVGIVESLTVLTEVQAGCTGVVTAALATDGQPAEYGQVLFEVTPYG